MACNPVLESWGNAQTVRNNNSSRFGKYLTLQLAPVGRGWHKKQNPIRGAFVKNYLLEKSRVTDIPKNELNYHIFYSFFKGLKEL